MKKILLLVFAMINTYVIYACINGETRELKDGTIISMEVIRENNIIPYGHDFNKMDYGKKSKEFYDRWIKTGDIAYYSDYGILLLLNKEYEKAEAVYLDIEKRKPGLYSTASNLGTLYELMGQNEKALIWIKKSYRINPESHFNSEWLHVKILEAKINGPSSITTPFLLGTNFGKADTPVTNLTQKKLYAMRDAIYYQLNERVSFIKPKEPIVALLLFEQGNIAWLTGYTDDAHKLYEMSREYGYNDPLLEIRELKVQGKTLAVKTLVNTSRTNDTRTMLWVFTGIALITSVVYYLIRRRRNAT